MSVSVWQLVNNDLSRSVQDIIIMILYHHVCFTSLQPMLQCGFEFCLGLEFAGFSSWRCLGSSSVWGLFVCFFFSPLRVLRFPPLLQIMVSVNK